MNGLQEWAHGPQWPTTADRTAWGPVLERAREAWQQIELASVGRLRTSALVVLEPHELAQASADCARQGLHLVILGQRPEGNYRAAVTLTAALAASWHKAWAAGPDDDQVGQLLGFPQCCREFFAREWIARQSTDTTRAMATVEGPWETNILLRWLGVRLVPHLPCSATCEATIAQARAYLALGREVEADVAAIEALLRLPVTYDADGPLAIVTTPHFRFMLGTDKAGSTTLVRAGQGNALPPAPSHELNGFATYGAMQAAHAVVARAVGPVGSALDLGCGDGALLRQLGGHGQGVEIDPARAAQGGPGVQQGNLVDFCRNHVPPPTPFDVVLLMPGRLLEVAPADAALVRATLPRVARRLVVYAYGDTLLRKDGLAGLAEEAGLRLVGELVSGPGAQASEAVVQAVVHLGGV